MERKLKIKIGHYFWTKISMCNCTWACLWLQLLFFFFFSFFFPSGRGLFFGLLGRLRTTCPNIFFFPFFLLCVCVCVCVCVFFFFIDVIFFFRHEFFGINLGDWFCFFWLIDIEQGNQQSNLKARIYVTRKSTTSTSRHANLDYLCRRVARISFVLTMHANEKMNLRLEKKIKPTFWQL